MAHIASRFSFLPSRSIASILGCVSSTTESLTLQVTGIDSDDDSELDSVMSMVHEVVPEHPLVHDVGFEAENCSTTITNQP